MYNPYFSTNPRSKLFFKLLKPVLLKKVFPEVTSGEFYMTSGSPEITSGSPELISGGLEMTSGGYETTSG